MNQARDSELFLQIRRGQLRKVLEAHLVVFERIRVLLEPHRQEPRPNVHGRSLREPMHPGGDHPDEPAAGAWTPNRSALMARATPSWLDSHHVTVTAGPPSTGQNFRNRTGQNFRN